MDRVISLKRTPERLARFRELNPDFATITVQEAHDGLLLDPSRMEAGRIIAPGLRYSPGALGCLMSHVQVWTEVAASSPLKGWAFVCEDDAVICGPYDECIPADEGWDIALLGWNFDAPASVDILPGVTCTIGPNQAGLMANIRNARGWDYETDFLRLRRACGTVAYAISQRGARKLLDRLLPMRPGYVMMPQGPVENVGVDIALNSVYDTINAYVAFPPVVVTANDRATSTVANS